jgi:hypothetical protein
MNDDARLISAALDRRFSRAGLPGCPDGAWHAKATEPSRIARPSSVPRKFAYAAALVAGVAAAGLAAQASGTVKLGNLPFWSHVSSKPLTRIIHAADQLTITEAQRRMPFTIVEPKGLPANTRLLYAHVVSESPVHRVALRYEAHIGSKYYDITFNEATKAVGPPVAHFTLMNVATHVTKTWTAPLRRWKQNGVVMEMHAWGLPAALSDHIVHENTL